MLMFNFIRKLKNKLKASFFVFKKAEIMQNIVTKEINGGYVNQGHNSVYDSCLTQKEYRGKSQLKNSNSVRIAVYLGGALGDYIVYLRFVDELTFMDNCNIDLFFDRIGFANFVFGKRKNINLCYDIDNCLFINNKINYDLALSLDHGVKIYHDNLNIIKSKSYEIYLTTCKILEYVKKNAVDIDEQQNRQVVIIKKAKYAGDTKWSKLSCGGAVNMSDMYSSILLYPQYYDVIERYNLINKKYITVNYGADKNMGGESQTKVLPSKNFENFIKLFKTNYPGYTVVQMGTANSNKLEDVDIYAFNCTLDETAILLKNSTIHVDSEGGLVHLASQMSTCCVVCFGPTPSYYYGYPRNINIVSSVCNDCMSATNSWNINCPKGLRHPECMLSITGQMIFNRVDEFISQNYTVHIDVLKNEVLENTVEDVAIDYINTQNKFANISIITTLKAELTEKINNKFKNVTVYTETQNSDFDKAILRWQNKIRKNGMKLKYGNALNIACKSNSFSLVILDLDTVDINYFYYVIKELSRITEHNGKVIIYGNSLNKINFETFSGSLKSDNIILDNEVVFKDNDNCYLELYVNKNQDNG